MGDFSKFKGLFAGDLDRETDRDSQGYKKSLAPTKPFNPDSLDGLNDGQRQMVLDIVEYLGPNSRNLPYFVVYGAGGFGKTYAIIRALLHLDPESIGAATPSHFAKNVLQDAMGDDIKVATIASIMGKKLIYEEGKAVLVQNPKYKFRSPPVADYDVLIVDEISMVDDVTGREIVQACKNKRLIVMGDFAQLPAVGQPTDSFFFDTVNAELTESMRFQGPIEALTTAIRGEVVKMRQDLIPNLNVINYFTDRVSVVDETGSGYVFMNSEAIMLHTAIKRFQERKGTNYIRIIAYRNKTIDKLTKQVRSKLYGADPKQYEVGEILISEGGYSVQGKPVINNGQIFTVARTEQVMGPYNIKCVQLTFVEDVQGPILAVAQEDLEKYDKLLRRLKRAANKDKEHWKHFHTLLEAFARFGYAYVLTSHRAQGSSISYVYVLEDDILGVKPTTVKEKLQSLYVAVSRASFRVYIFNKGFKVSYDGLNKTYLKITPDMSKREIAAIVASAKKKGEGDEEE